MRAKWVILGGVALICLGLLTWIIALPLDWENWLGFSRYDYFTGGTVYAFFSGAGPFMLTALGFGTVIGGLWHTHNCHVDGCWNIGKHKVKGSPYCNVHLADAQSVKDTDDLLTEISAKMDKLIAALTPQQGGSGGGTP